MKNVIYDGKYYYFFRAISKWDLQDIQNNNIGEIRTNCIRKYDRDNTWGKYNNISDLSLEELYDHIKIRHRYDTNCISLTKNSNVAVTYHKNKGNFAIIRVTPQELKDYFEAGEYFKREIKRQVKKVINGISDNEPILNLLHDIDNAKTKKQLIEIVNKLDNKKSARGKRYLNEGRDLLVSKLAVKLSILEQEGLIGDIIEGVPNSELLKTMSLAYSSSEIIHYGNIPKESIILCPKIFVDIFSLIQQKQEKSTEELERLTRQILGLVKNGYDIKIKKRKSRYNQW